LLILYYDKYECLPIKDDNIKIICDYVDGKMHGECRRYWDTGFLSDIKYYINGQRDGKHTSYYDDGKKILSIEHYVNGIREGLYEEYYESENNIVGKIFQNFNYINGNIEGEYKIYNEDGTLCKVYTYVKGKRIKCKEYINNKLIATLHIND
jgi:antitoxin component YwqK of YwqJK toxin-antitoxin module